jgi:hypothetical protein
MSDETIRAGDLVMLVWACCPKGRSYLGWTGTVAKLCESELRCRCGFVMRGTQAIITINRTGYVPLAWLRKINPPAETTEREKEMAI